MDKFAGSTRLNELVSESVRACVGGGGKMGADESIGQMDEKGS